MFRKYIPIYFIFITGLFSFQIDYCSSSESEDESDSESQSESESGQIPALMHKLWIAGAKNGDVEVIKLIESKLDVNEPDENGNTALILATKANKPKAVEALLAIPGIDVNAQTDKRKWTAFSIACFRGYTEIVNLFLKNLPCAICRAKIGAKQHCDKCLDINKHDNIDEHTPLMYACRRGQTAVMMELLTEPGTYVNFKNKEGINALHVAVRRGHHKAVALLLSNPDIDVDLEAYDGVSALEKAQKARVTRVTALVMQKLHPDLVAKVFELLEHDNTKEAIPLIKKLGFGIFNKDGDTPLHYAAKNQKIDQLLELLRSNAEPQNLLALQNRVGKTVVESTAIGSSLFNLYFKMIAHTSDKICGRCGKIGCTDFCGRCKKMYYCSANCQKADWKAHKNFCVAR